jgi:hypothetical protein
MYNIVKHSLAPWRRINYQHESVEETWGWSKRVWVVDRIGGRLVQRKLKEAGGKTVSGITFVSAM